MVISLHVNCIIIMIYKRKENNNKERNNNSKICSIKYKFGVENQVILSIN